MATSRPNPLLAIVLSLAMTGPMLSSCGAISQTPPKLEAPPAATQVRPVPPAVGVVQSDQARIEAPNVAPADLQVLVAGNTGFAFDLYQALRGKAGNLIFSPYSISLALAMPYAGARGNTGSQMSGALQFNLPAEALHPAFDALDLSLASRSTEKAAGGQQQGLQLKIANAIWAQRDRPFRPEYLDLLASYYGAGLHQADFAQAAEPARLEINGWVSKQTENKINDLIPRGAINELARLVLVNAIYFKGGWQEVFEAPLTRPAPFQLLDGKQVNVNMMSMNEPASLSYASGDGYQAVELPYQGGEAAMDILMPQAGTFDGFERSLTAQRLNEMLGGLRPASVALQMPKFSFTSELSLGQTLADMGMPDAFDSARADFSGMDGQKDLFIQAALHKAFVAVDEQGTEAAAATAVIVGATAMRMTEVTLTIDHPFIFVIRDLPTGSLLFVGRVVNPAG